MQLDIQGSDARGRAQVLSDSNAVPLYVVMTAAARYWCKNFAVNLTQTAESELVDDSSKKDVSSGEHTGAITNDLETML